MIICTLFHILAPIGVACGGVWAIVVVEERKEPMRIKIFKRKWSMDDHTPLHKCHASAFVEAPTGEECVRLARAECARRDDKLTEKQVKDGWKFEFHIV